MKSISEMKADMLKYKNFGYCGCGLPKSYCDLENKVKGTKSK